MVWKHLDHSVEFPMTSRQCHVCLIVCSRMFQNVPEGSKRFPRSPSYQESDTKSLIGEFSPPCRNPEIICRNPQKYQKNWEKLGIKSRVITPTPFDLVQSLYKVLSCNLLLL